MSNTSRERAPSIFISYRIADTLQIADRLAAELKRKFGTDEVFFDGRTIDPGDNWPSRIESAVKGARIVLVLIGERWLREQNEHSIRRLDLPGDWVRREVEVALRNKRLVVPVLVDDASPPPGAAFATVPSIAALSTCQGKALRTRDWDMDFGALVAFLETKGLSVLPGTDAERANIVGRVTGSPPNRTVAATGGQVLLDSPDGRNRDSDLAWYGAQPAGRVTN